MVVGNGGNREDRLLLRNPLGKGGGTLGASNSLIDSSEARADGRVVGERRGAPVVPRSPPALAVERR